MTLDASLHPQTVIVRAQQAEQVGRDPVKVQLLADSNATGGALSTIRVSMQAGADGARPHHHAGSSEMFYVLEGTVEVLSGTEIVQAERGDLIVVPPRSPHAFAAARGKSADLLIVIAPGVERFEYFRKLERIAYGKEPPESLRDMQELYDTFFLSSPEWDAARAASRT
jgi:mannose-6-phosphate isomerase-like protein (cupin superfamily)